MVENTESKGAPPASAISVEDETIAPVKTGQVGIGVAMVYQATQNGQPLAGWAVTETVSGTAVADSGQELSIDYHTGLAFTDSNGFFLDTQRYAGSGPFSIGIYQNMTLTNVATGQQSSFTVGYFGRATGTNQGVITGSNGVFVSQ